MVQMSTNLDCKFRWAGSNSGFIKSLAKGSLYVKKLLGALTKQPTICRCWKRKAAATDTTHPSTPTSRNWAGYFRQTVYLCLAPVRFVCSLYRLVTDPVLLAWPTQESKSGSQCHSAIPCPLQLTHWLASIYSSLPARYGSLETDN